MQTTITRIAPVGIVMITSFMTMPSSHVAAQWSVIPRSVSLLSPGDLNGITEMSGVVFLGTTGNNHQFAAVQDTGNQLALFDVVFTSDGSLISVTGTSGLSLSPGFDFEGIAYTDVIRNSVFISEETTPTVREYDLTSGSMLQTLAMPAAFDSIRGNRGLESLTRTIGDRVMWTANEESLKVDGPAATTTNGTIVRLQQLLVEGNLVIPASQYAYQVESIHATGFFNQSKRGLTDIVALPDGTVLTLERSFAAFADPIYLNQIYRVDFSAATDISWAPLAAGLSGQNFVPVDKQLLVSFTVGPHGENLEGLALGPRLANGNWTMLGVVDDGDVFSNNTVVSFELLPPHCNLVGDYDCSDAVNEFDYLTWKDTFASTSLGFADGNQSGKVNAVDYILWRNNLGVISTKATSIPEPASFWLGLLCSLAIKRGVHQPGKSR